MCIYIRGYVFCFFFNLINNEMHEEIDDDDDIFYSWIMYINKTIN